MDNDRLSRGGGDDKKKKAKEVKSFGEEVIYASPIKKAVPVSDWGEEVVVAPVEKKNQVGNVSNNGSPTTASQFGMGVVDDFNKSFESATGHRKISLSEPIKPTSSLLQPLYEKRKQDFEGKKFLEYKKEEENINEVLSNVHFGTTSKDELTTLSKNPYGQNEVKNLLQQYSPKAPQNRNEVLAEGEHWDDAVKNINTANRKNAVELLGKLNQESVANVQNAFNNFTIKTDITDYLPTPGGGAFKTSTTATDKIPEIDFTSKQSVANAIHFLDDKGYLVGKDGKRSEYGLDKLYKDLNVIYEELVNSRPIDAEIESLENLPAAVAINQRTSEITSDKVNDGVNDPLREQHFKAGLNYIKDLQPGTYKGIILGIKDKGMISETDFQQVSRIGQDIVNKQVFKNAATNPELIDKETNFNYNTYQDEKAQYALAIGEWAKDNGYTNMNELPEKVIRKGAQQLGLNSKAIVDELVMEEGIFGYDAIPKSGWIEALARGVEIPFAGIKSTFQKWTSESPAETYLNSKKLDIGTSQKVPDVFGNLTNELPSDRGNIWYDIVEGASQFVPQVFLTRGIGAPLGAAASTAAQARNVVNYGGTFISQFLQSYGDAYSEALRKTGDPATARVMGGIDATTISLAELILPDTKIASKAFDGLKNNLAKDIIGVLKNGGDLADIRTKARPFIQKFATEFADITTKEVSEEVVSQWANYLDEAIFSPGTVKDRDLGKETWETIKATAISMVIPAVLGGGGSSMNKDFTVNGLHASAINFDDSKSSLEKALIKGDISQTDFNSGISILKTHRESIFSSPKTDVNDKELSRPQQLEYAYQDTQIKILNEQLKNADGTVKKEIIQDKIKKAEEIQRSIVAPKIEERGDTFKVEVEDNTQPILLTPEEKIVELVNNGIVLGGAEMAIKADPSQATEALRFIAQQAYGITETGEKASGGIAEIENKEALAAAKERFPTSESTLEKTIPSQASDVVSAVIEIGGKMYEGKNHAEAILKAKADGQDISQVNRQAQGKFKLSDGTIIDRAEAKQRFGQDRSELMIEQDAAADQANKDYRKITQASDVVGKGDEIENWAKENGYNISDKEDFDTATKMATQRPNYGMGNMIFGKEEKVEERKDVHEHTYPKTGKTYKWTLGVYENGNGGKRYLLYDEKYPDQIDAGAIVDKDGKVAHIRTDKDYRNIGLAQTLLSEIKKDYGKITPSEPISKEGARALYQFDKSQPSTPSQTKVVEGMEGQGSGGVGGDVVATEDAFPVSELNKLPKGELHRSDESKQKLKEDISKNGIKEPLTLVYYVKDNALRLKEGHHRLDAANKLGMKDVPVKVQVEWGKSIKDDNDIQGQKLYHPPTPLDVDGYKKRNYQPSNIELNELGFKEQSLKETPKAGQGMDVGGERVKTKEASNEEPPLPKGETIVTLSGMTESERQNKIAERKGSTGLSESEKSENKLAELSYKADKLRAGNEKTNAQSNIRQEVRKFNAEVGNEKYKYNGVNVFKKTTIRKGGNKGREVWRKISAINKDVGNQSVKEGGKPLRDRSRELQENFDNLVSVAEHLEVPDANGRAMSKEQIDAAVQDIYDGIPSVQAENLLDVLEEGVRTDDFPIKDNFANEQVRLNDLLGTQSEILSEPLTEDAIKDWLNDESKLTPEQEDILNKEFENLLYEFPEIETEIPISETKTGTETTTTPKVESKVADQQAAKKVTSKNETTKSSSEGTKPISTEKRSEPKAEPNKPSQEAAEPKIGKYEEKARKLAEKINKAELPSWLKADLPEGTQKQGVSTEQLQKALADATIAMGKLLDKGVEFSQAVKEAVNGIVDLLGEGKRADIEKGFADDYKKNVLDPIKKEKEAEIKEKRKEALKLRKALKDIDIYARSGLEKNQVEEIFKKQNLLTPKVQELIDKIYDRLEQTEGTKQNERKKEETKIAEGKKILDEIFAKIKNGQKIPKVFIRLTTSDAADLIPYLKGKYSTYKGVTLDQLEKVADSLIEIFGLDVASDMIKDLDMNEKPIAMAKVAMKLREEGRTEEAAKVMADLIQTGTAAGQTVKSFDRVKSILGSITDPTFRTEFQKAMYERMQAERKAAEAEFGMQSDVFKEKISDLEKQIHEKTINDNKSLFSKLVDKICGLRKRK